MSPSLGRLTPPDFEHVAKYPYRALQPELVAHVERSLALPTWHKNHNQGQTGTCTGHGSGMERAITNIAQNKKLKIVPTTVRYNPLKIYNHGCELDGFADTTPGDYSTGTTVRAVYDGLRQYGAQRVLSMRLDPQQIPYPIELKTPAAESTSEGVVSVNRWATSIDEIRDAISQGKPVPIGVNWYASFFNPTERTTGTKGALEYWIGEDAWGAVEGGHCVCLYGASDRRQAFHLKNNWGDWPTVWISYKTMQRLLDEQGEAAIVVDK